MINRETIMSVGVVMGRSLPFVNVNTTIRVFRHALSLDEVRDHDLLSAQSPTFSRQHRARYRPRLYQSTPPRNSSQTSELDVIKPGTDELFNTDVKEVWFAGCHSGAFSTTQVSIEW
jgi:hypothetical protein